MGSKAVLIVGGSGLLGTHLALKLRNHFKVYSTYHTRPFTIPGVTYFPVEIENKNWIKRILLVSQPDSIIYVVGSNNSAWTEENRRLAETLHSNGPASLLGATEIVQPRFIYVSNSYVYDGTKGNYHESDTASPNTALGRIKLSGENVVRSKFLNYIILRSCPILGRSHGPRLSFLDHLRMSLSQGKIYEASPHEVHSYAHIDQFCQVVHRIIDSGIRNRAFNFGGLTKLSHYDFAHAFAKRFKFDPNLIVAKKGTLRKGGINEDSVFDYSLNSSFTVEQLKVQPLLLEQSFDLIEEQLVPRLGPLRVAR